MFINFWYAAEESKNLTDQPLHVRMLGQDFVVFRDSSGEAHCLSNTCCHRGASLAHGKIKGDCVECPYHGWQYDGDGVCRRIPSMGPDAKIPTRAKVDAYPTEERYGLIFAFLGDLREDERPPILKIPEWDQEGWRWTSLNYAWETDYKRAMENSLDPAHTEFVHPMFGYEGERDDYKVPDLEFNDYEWGTGVRWLGTSSSTKPDSLKSSVREEGANTYANNGHLGPTHSWVFLDFTKDNGFRQYSYATPIDEKNYRNFFFNGRNFLMDPSQDERVFTRLKEVAEQDRNVVERIRPFFTPGTNAREIFVSADGSVGPYREKLAEWEAKGWRIDIDEVNRNKDKVAYAIPSPARRESKGWALDPIPLISATSSKISRAAE